ncbi:MBL fold metallo-hydrolase [Pokkaliibacter plantistimulans]|uniref:MBL fold metallo-hydrolase n=1 Tax=Proteobacteria bacterium 228 TaxID=2083153 RepID=A0A2S5KW16_9PROT|nr:MBL fold metallo-hydrolase [Pokkaliibacter plantistimulans]PPC78466.1 MBL fold metallo-hydrolase [Pokkaliibacter plantistimulans]
MRGPVVTPFFDESTFTFSYLVRDPDSTSCAIIDSVLDFDYAAGRTSVSSVKAVLDFVKLHGLSVEWILETHVHADHLSAAPYLKEHTDGRIGIGSHITVVQETFGKAFNAGAEFTRDGSQFDHLFTDGESFKVGTLAATALHTPGHTPACMTYVIGDAAFVGDTLFMPDYGTARCDFPGGDAATLFRSINKIYALPADTRLFMCHDYKAPGREHYAYETTVQEQRENNIHVHQGTSEADFVSMRTQRDATLSMPRLILPSVQVNMRAGHMPPEESNGQVYLKVPINLF